MEIPDQFKKYDCADYFISELSDQGFWDEAGQVWLIEPASRVEELCDSRFLQVGRPGVDGIGFGYRKDVPGFWAYHPIESEYQLLATTLAEFLKGWYSGNICV